MKNLNSFLTSPARLARVGAFDVETKITIVDGNEEAFFDPSESLVTHPHYFQYITEKVEERIEQLEDIDEISKVVTELFRYCLRNGVLFFADEMESFDLDYEGDILYAFDQTLAKLKEAPN
ncbi:MAG: hypothetical protein CL489_10225 [Acidobacteria bacterium]|nr:hypothetical protein [Acidobacteriota bacterium]|tara:strand:+ start:3863 stop:4225 length:363 start_codon:yes stop_codon:yes gene_type:complete